MSDPTSLAQLRKLAERMDRAAHGPIVDGWVTDLEAILTDLEAAQHARHIQDKEIANLLALGAHWSPMGVADKALEALTYIRQLENLVRRAYL